MQKRWGFLRDLHWATFIPISLGLLVLIAGWRAVTANSGLLSVTYLDVGQGDSALIRGPDGFDVLIDGGRVGAGPTVVAYLRNASVDDIDVMLASHNDADHIGGLVDVLEINDIPVRQVLYNGYDADTDLFRAFATAAAQEGAPLQAAQFPASYSWGLMAAEVLNPPPGLPANVTQNDASVLVLITYGDTKLLFPGDIETGGEAQVLSRDTPVAAQVLKVAHHGSDSSTSPDFLAAVLPTDAVISVGSGNPYGHPDQEVLDSLEALGVEIWRTDINRNIYLSSDGTAYEMWADVMHPVWLPLVNANLCSPSGSWQVFIRTIFYDGVVSIKEPDEYVEFTNLDHCPLQLAGWTLRDQSLNVFTFPDFVLAPGQVCRVYTNEDHPQWCGFNWHKGNPVWNNSGECGSLWNSSGQLIDEYCYP
jgi:competence protein ComEC